MFSSTFYEEALPPLRKHPTTTNVAQTADKERKKWGRTETNADRKVNSLSQVITYLENSNQSGSDQHFLCMNYTRLHSNHIEDTIQTKNRNARYFHLYAMQSNKAPNHTHTHTDIQHSSDT